MRLNFSTLFDRLKEPSTWRGLAVMGGVVGLNVSPTLAPQIATLCGAIYSLINIFRSEEKPVAFDTPAK